VRVVDVYVIPADVHEMWPS